MNDGVKGPVLILLGPPASGKGDLRGRIQNFLLGQNRTCASLATGDYFRQLRSCHDKEGHLNSFDYRIATSINWEDMDRGVFVPDELTMRVVDCLLTRALKTDLTIIDGVPRNQNQAVKLLGLLKSHDYGKIFVIEIVADFEVCESHLREGCGRGRADDKTAEIRLARRKTYDDNLNSILKALEQKKDIVIRSILCERGENQDVVFERCRDLIGYILNPDTSQVSSS